jgi:hypothetical protein
MLVMLPLRNLIDAYPRRVPQGSITNRSGLSTSETQPHELEHIYHCDVITESFLQTPVWWI